MHVSHGSICVGWAFFQKVQDRIETGRKLRRLIVKSSAIELTAMKRAHQDKLTNWAALITVRQNACGDIQVAVWRALCVRPGNPPLALPWHRPGNGTAREYVVKLLKTAPNQETRPSRPSRPREPRSLRTSLSCFWEMGCDESVQASYDNRRSTKRSTRPGQVHERVVSMGAVFSSCTWTELA